MHLCLSDCEWLNTGMEHLTSEHQNIRAKVTHRISLEVYIFVLHLASFSFVHVCPPFQIIQGTNVNNFTKQPANFTI